MNSFLAFFNIGAQESVIIFCVILLLFGAKKLPELARGIGKSLGEFKRARSDFEEEIIQSQESTPEKAKGSIAQSEPASSTDEKKPS